LWKLTFVIAEIEHGFNTFGLEFYFWKSYLQRYITKLAILAWALFLSKHQKLFINIHTTIISVFRMV